MSRTLVIYPFGRETAPLLRHTHLLPYDLVVPVSAPGWGAEGQDISFFDGGESCGIPIRSDLATTLNECDDIFIPYEEDVIIEHYIHAIDLAMEREKNILIVETLYLELIKEPGSEDLKKYANLRLLGFDKIDINLNDQPEESRQRIHQINAPVVAVFGDGRFTGKFKLQLGIYDFFVKQGYKPLLLSSKEYARLYSPHALPQFLFESVRLGDKIKAFNEYLVHLAHKENPDLIILGVPGGTQPFFIDHPEDYGEFALVLSRAAPPDIAIRSLYANRHEEHYIIADQKICDFLVLCTPEYYTISNMEIMEETNYSPLSYLTVQSKPYIELLRENPNTEYTVFNGYDSAQMEAICFQMLNELADNPNAV